IDMGPEMMREPEAIERRRDIGGAARRGDRARTCKRRQKLGRTGNWGEAIGEARSCAFAVLLTKVGRKRAAEPRLDPPLRFLPVVTIIVAQTILVAGRQADCRQALGKRLVRAYLAVGDDAVEVENDRSKWHGIKASPPAPAHGPRAPRPTS